MRELFLVINYDTEMERISSFFPFDEKEESNPLFEVNYKNVKFHPEKYLNSGTLVKLVKIDTTYNLNVTLLLVSNINGVIFGDILNTHNFNKYPEKYLINLTDSKKYFDALVYLKEAL